MTQAIEITSETEPKTENRKINELPGSTLTGVDELVLECDMSAASVRSTLVKLELTRRTERHSGNRVRLIL